MGARSVRATTARGCCLLRHGTVSMKTAGSACESRSTLSKQLPSHPGQCLQPRGSSVAGASEKVVAMAASSVGGCALAVLAAKAGAKVSQGHRCVLRGPWIAAWGWGGASIFQRIRSGRASGNLREASVSSHIRDRTFEKPESFNASCMASQCLLRFTVSRSSLRNSAGAWL